MIHINNLKLDEFKKDRSFVISDFDMTITKPGSMTCWNLFARNNIVPPELQVCNRKLYNFYRQIEIMDDIPIYEYDLGGIMIKFNYAGKMIGRGCIPYCLMKNGYRKIPIYDNDCYLCDDVFVVGYFKIKR